MKPAEALRAAHAAGVTVTLDRESLLLNAEVEPPQHVLVALRLHKNAIRALLQSGKCRRTTEQWRTYFEGRNRIETSANGLAQSKPHQQAVWVVEWLNAHPAPPASGRCVQCGKPEFPGAVVLPFGTEPKTHTWLHAECWSAWHSKKASAALAPLGIRAGGGDDDCG